MNKQYFLLIIFLSFSVTLFSKTSSYPVSFNTYGLPLEEYEKLKGEAGDITFTVITEYLTKSIPEIEADVQSNYWKVKAFHSWVITETNAPHFAQMKDCETCPTLGELVASSEELSKVFPKIIKAYSTLMNNQSIEQTHPHGKNAQQPPTQVPKRVYNSSSLITSSPKIIHAKEVATRFLDNFTLEIAML